MSPSSPTVASWALGRQLRERRQERGLTGPAAARLTGVTAAYLSDVETGKKRVSEQRLEALLEQYGFADHERPALREFRAEASFRGWWADYSSVFEDDLIKFFGYEHGAASVRTYDGGVVNALLQTEDYARALTSSTAPHVRSDEVDRRVRCRMRRQHRLTDDTPLRVEAVMSEAVVRQQVGGPEVLAGQLRHLLDVMHRHAETVAVRIVPFDSPGHPAMGGGTFHLMRFPSEWLPTVLWHESLASTHLISDRATVRDHILAHDSAAAAALDPETSFHQIGRAHV